MGSELLRTVPGSSFDGGVGLSLSTRAGDGESGFVRAAGLLWENAFKKVPPKEVSFGGSRARVKRSYSRNVGLQTCASQRY